MSKKNLKNKNINTRVSFLRDIKNYQEMRENVPDVGILFFLFNCTLKLVTSSIIISTNIFYSTVIKLYAALKFDVEH